jgi:hypothetical protein
LASPRSDDRTTGVSLSAGKTTSGAELLLHRAPEDIDRRQPAADDDDVRVEGMDDVREAGGQAFGHPLEDADGILVSGKSRLLDVERRRLAARVPFVDAGHRGTGRQSLEMPFPAAAARFFRIEVDDHVPDLPGGVIAAAIQPAVDDDAAADARAQREADDVALVPAGAVGGFPEDEAMHVVVDRRRHPVALLEERGDRDVAERAREVRSLAVDALGVVDHAGQPGADAGDPGNADGVDRRRDVLQDGLPPLGGFGRPFVGLQDRAGRRDERGADLRAADIDADDGSFGHNG